MKRLQMAARLFLAIIALAAALSPEALAQYPDTGKRITLVVPFSAGGSNDILARVIGQRMSDDWHIPVIIENHVGASGALGAARVAQALPRWLHTAHPVIDLHDQFGSDGTRCHSIRRQASRRSSCSAEGR